MSAARIMPPSARITAAHARKHTRTPADARPWCPLCATPTPAPTPKRTKTPPAPVRKPIPGDVSDSARIVVEFLGSWDLPVNGELLRALAQAGTGTPAPKRTRKAPVRKAQAVPDSPLTAAFVAGEVVWAGDTLAHAA